MAKLDPRIEEIRAQYGLETGDFWELPQKRGTWIAKHSALEKVAIQAKLKFDPPQIIEADTANGVAVLAVNGHRPDGYSFWSTGEASKSNNKNAYPWAMAEKRAIDRIILKLVGLHGLVYSEDEGDFDAPKVPQVDPSPVGETAPAKNPDAKPKAQSRETYEKLQEELRQIKRLGELGDWWKDSSVQADIKTLPSDWAAALIKEKDELKADLNKPVSPQESLDELASLKGKANEHWPGAMVREVAR